MRNVLVFITVILLASCKAGPTSGSLVGLWKCDSVDNNVLISTTERYTEKGTYKNTFSISVREKEPMVVNSSGTYEREGDVVLINFSKVDMGVGKLEGGLVERHLIEVSDSIMIVEQDGKITKFYRVKDGAEN